MLYNVMLYYVTLCVGKYFRGVTVCVVCATDHYVRVWVGEGGNCVCIWKITVCVCVLMSLSLRVRGWRISVCVCVCLCARAHACA